MESLLKDRFGMVASFEKRPVQHLEIVRAREDGRLGPNIQALENRDQCMDPEVRAKLPLLPQAGGVQYQGCGPVTTTIIRSLALLTGQIVVDRTGLSFVMYRLFMPESVGAVSTLGQRLPPRSRPPYPDQGNLRYVVQSQLGLKLQETRDPVEVLVITSINRPTPN